MFKVIDLHHVAAIVKDLEGAIATFSHNFDFRVEQSYEMPEFNARNAFLPVGPAWLELLTPIDEDAPPAGRLKETGEGLYHIVLTVDDLDAAIETLRARSVKVGDPVYAPDVQTRVAAISSRHTNGAAILLAESE